MPYLTPRDRAYVDEYSDPVQPGELTYLLTKVIVRYVSRCGPRFLTFAEVLGALEATKQEFYRRVVAPYEDQKMRENGDVYGDLVSV